jgi:hypothetical protein
MASPLQGDLCLLVGARLCLPVFGVSVIWRLFHGRHAR